MQQTGCERFALYSAYLVVGQSACVDIACLILKRLVVGNNDTAVIFRVVDDPYTCKPDAVCQLCPPELKLTC